MSTDADIAVNRWLVRYKEANHNLLLSNPEFSRWLDEEYVPIAGGWMY
jgi:hypothetical protein